MLPRPAKSLQNSAGFSETALLNLLGLPNGKEWSQCPKESSWQGCQAFFDEKKRSRAISRSLGRDEGKKGGSSDSM